MSREPYYLPLNFDLLQGSTVTQAYVRFDAFPIVLLTMHGNGPDKLVRMDLGKRVLLDPVESTPNSERLDSLAAQVSGALGLSGR